MSRATVSRTVKASPTQAMGLLLDFERYPSFVPGVRRVRTTPVASAPSKEAAEVEAFVKNSRFSGTLRVLVQADRAGGRVLVNHKFGPFKTLTVSFHVSAAAAQTTVVRCDLEVASTVAAINAIVAQYLKAAANAYADVFVGELKRLAEANLSPT